MLIFMYSSAGVGAEFIFFVGEQVGVECRVGNVCAKREKDTRTYNDSETGELVCICAPIKRGTFPWRGAGHTTTTHCGHSGFL